MHSSDIDDLLAQKFHYLGRGAQMLVFLGEDRKTILKLFKMNHLLPKTWLNFLPLPTSLHDYRKRKTTYREKKLEKTFQSIKLANEKLPEETGVIFAKLNPTCQKKYITLIDKQRREHLIDLRRVPFVLQKRAELIYERLARHLKHEQKLKEEIGKILSLVTRRCQKGIFDTDSGVSANYGFVDDKAVQIDIGGFYQDDSSYEEEINRIEGKIKKWITKKRG